MSDDSARDPEREPDGSTSDGAGAEPSAGDASDDARPAAPSAAPPGVGDDADLYDRWALGYDAVARFAPAIGRLRRRAVDALKLERGDVVVEFGCGTGANLPLLAREVGPTGRVLGVDTAPGSLELARRYVGTYPQVDVVRADATTPPVGGDVDAVLGTFVVGMLEAPGDAVGTWCDLVDGDGHVALLHLRRSEHLAAPLANAGLEAITRLSVPPLSRLRYERTLSRDLDRRVREAHDALRSRADATVTESHLLDLVELTGGRFEE